jgi:hypothetical protein
MHEQLTTFPMKVGYDTRTSNNLPYSGIMIYEHLATFPIVAL